MNILKQIVCLWLFYILDAIILVGLVKVEVQSIVREKKDLQAGKQNNFESATTRNGLWTGTISEKINIRNNAIRIEHSKLLIPRPTELVNTVCVTRGLCILFEENPVWCHLVLIIHSLLSIFVFIYFLTRVGRKIKWLLENLITFLHIIPKHCNNQALNSMVLSLLFLILGLTLCVPLRNLYLTELTDQEDGIVRKISSEIIQNDNIVPLSINVDWLLVLYFSFLSIGFLLSFSYCFATAIDLMRQELKQQLTADNYQNELVTEQNISLNV